MPVKITSKYTPLTYDEITRPLIQATEAQAAMENAYMDATDKAAQAMAAANQQSDPIAYNRLKAYAEDLQAHADSLVRNGLQRTSRQGLLNLRRRYGEEIAPIENAIARRRELADEQRKLQATNPYLRFERNMDTTSLDDFLTNAELDYGRSIDLDDVSKKAATITKALGQGRTDVRNGRQIDKYTKEVLTREGFTPEEIQAALSNDENADYALRSALNNLYTSTGASSFGADVNAEVRDALDYGAYLGAGEVKSQIMTDQVANRRDELADREHSEAFQAALYGMYKNNEGNWVYDPNNPGPKVKTKVNIDGSVNVSDGNLERSTMKDANFSSYIYKTQDGKYLVEGARGKKYLATDQVAAKEAFEKDAKAQKFLKTYYSTSDINPTAGVYLRGEEKPSETRQDPAGRWDTWDAEIIQYKELPKKVKEYYKGLCESNNVDPLDMIFEKDQEGIGGNKFRMYYNPKYKDTHPDYNKKLDYSDGEDNKEDEDGSQTKSEK